MESIELQESRATVGRLVEAITGKSRTPEDTSILDINAVCAEAETHRKVAEKFAVPAKAEQQIAAGSP